MTLRRRTFLRSLGLMTVGASGLPAWRAATAEDSAGAGYVAAVPADTGASGRVIVVGGGMAGATAAKYLRLWGGQRVQVTLVERDAAYVSNIMSNLVLNGARSVAQLTYGWNALRDRYGVNVVQGELVGVDPVARSVTVARADGARATLPYDRLVLAPGIEFDAMPGLEAADYDTAFPHAWKAGAQTTLLRQQLQAMPAGGAFVMTIPAAPYRCPPGPYERACVVADWLKRNRPGSTVVVLDENPDITAEKHSFETGFLDVHRGVVRYERSVRVVSIERAAAGGARALVRTELHGDFAAHVLNPIPPQRAPRWLNALGLIGPAERWALVDPKTYERIGLPGVHVIGDAANHGLPKAGHVANVEAKVCADAITRALRGQGPDPEPMANSACYSPITATTASWLTAVYRYDATAVPPRMTMVGPPAAEAARITTDNFEEMGRWFAQLMADSFA